MTAAAPSSSPFGVTADTGPSHRVFKPFSDEIARDLIKDAQRTMGKLKSQRELEFAHWRECAQWIDPRRGEWLWTEKKDRTKLHGSIVNNAAFTASQVGAAGMQSGLTSRSRAWFRLTTFDPRLRKDPEAKEWLREVESLMREIFDRSNLYETTRINYRELFNFGNGAFSVVPDFDNVIRCRHHTIGSYFLGINSKGHIDTFAEEFVLTVGQMMERYDIENMSMVVKTLIKNHEYNGTVKIIRLIEPNRGKYFRPGTPGWKGAAFRVLEYDPSDQLFNLLALEPEHEFPVIVSRWETMSDHAYAGGWPGAHALGDVKQVQSDEITLAGAKQQNNNPTTIGPPILRGQLGRELQPGQRLYTTEMEGQQGLRRVFEIDPLINEQRIDIAIVVERIEKTYHQDVFMAITRIDGGNMRVVEIDARIREQMSQLGPIVEGLSEQQNDPLIFRTYQIMERAGIIPEVPPVLEGVPIKIDYISILAQAAKAADIDKLERWATAAQTIVASDPSARHRFDGDEWMKEYGDQLGVPTKTIRGDRAVAQLVRLDQQRDQMEMASQAALDGAKAAKDASGADLDGNTALGAAIDAARGQQQ